jgi:putative endonuclease
MAKHSEIGIKGEQIAADFLQNKGYKIVHCNWRSGKKEVDIVAAMDNLVVFVEVKTRSSARLLYPEEAVNRKKQGNLREAAEAFLAQNEHYTNVRFDIVAVVLAGEHIKEIVHFEEAF